MVGKRHIADALTASRFLFAFIIIIMTIVEAHAAKVLAVFVLGELTDAIDGPAARKWHYSSYEERSLWRRRHKKEFDIAADMALGAAALIYVALRTYSFGMVLLIGATTIATISQILVLFVLIPKVPRIANAVICLRLLLLYTSGIAMAIIMLLMKATEGRPVLFWILLGIGVIAGAILLYLRKDKFIERFRKILEDIRSGFTR